MSADIEKIYQFTKVLSAFKMLERFKGQKFWRDYPFPKRYESNADHTWRMAMLLVMIQPRLSLTIDLEKALKMLLVHDIPEILAGDASPMGEDGTGNNSHAYNEEIKARRHITERQAAEELFGQLPSAIGKELLDLWLEYEANLSNEAKVVKAIDKFEGKLQVLEWTQGKMFPPHWEFTEKYGVESAEVEPALSELMTLLVEELRDNYSPQPGQAS